MRRILFLALLLAGVCQASVTFVVHGRVVTLDVPAWSDTTGAGARLATKSEVTTKAAISDTTLLHNEIVADTALLHDEIIADTSLLHDEIIADTSLMHDEINKDTTLIHAEIVADTTIMNREIVLRQTMTAVAAPATTGTMTITFTATSSVITITPTGNCTFDASGGTAGQDITFIVTTSGTSSYNLTFRTYFTNAGVLSTGLVSGKTFAVSFKCKDARYWVETGRTGPM